MRNDHRVCVFLGLGCCLSAAATMAAGAPAPRNQAELSRFAATATRAELSASGHAFGNENAKLWWFTDLEAAKKQAQLEGKPILSLRLLGKLSDEYSCANSRFFRVIFYPQAQINPQLRDNFVLHWSSERAVPVVTIDMGDGRVVKRTLTGNSAHYLLDALGRPLDVMPGLVTPARFAKWLENGAKLNRDWTQTPAQQREAFLSDWHRAKMGEKWREIEPKLGEKEDWVATQIAQSLKFNPLEIAAPERIGAEVAAPLAVAKSIGEVPILDATRLFASGARIEPVRLRRFSIASANTTPWVGVLDEPTRALIQAMNPSLAKSAASKSAASKPAAGAAQMQNISKTTVAFGLQTDPFATLLSRFEASIQSDDSLSLARFQIPIHASFIVGEAIDFATLNRKIYDRLFLTPRSDAWLGLGSEGAFTGLQNGGLFKEKPTSRP